MIEDGRVMIINPDGVQQMITILQEGMIAHNESDNKKLEKKKLSKKK